MVLGFSSTNKIFDGGNYLQLKHPRRRWVKLWACNMCVFECMDLCMCGWGILGSGLDSVHIFLFFLQDFSVKSRVPSSLLSWKLLMSVCDKKKFLAFLHWSQRSSVLSCLLIYLNPDVDLFFLMSFEAGFDFPDTNSFIQLFDGGLQMLNWMAGTTI